jgi:hypothetical protein
MPMLIRAYKYAILRAMGSFVALKRATASVPIKTDILIYATQAIIFREKSAQIIKISSQTNKQAPFRKEGKQDILRSFANHTLVSTLTGVGIFLGTRTCGGTVVIEW